MLNEELKLRQDYCRIKEQFKKRAESFDYSARWVLDKGLLDLHHKIAEICKNDLILEICCGTGVLGERLLHSDAKVIGLDFSFSMLEKAVIRLRFCVNGQAESLPFLDNVFDIVVCRQAFHFLDTGQVIKEMHRVIKPGAGKVIISQIVPFGENDSDWVWQIHRRKQPLLKNFLREEDLKELLKNTGFVDISMSQTCVKESINNWLKDTFYPESEIGAIKKMFLDAPKEYKALHRTRIIDGDIFDTMRWVVIRGRKK